MLNIRCVNNKILVTTCYRYYSTNNTTPNTTSNASQVGKTFNFQFQFNIKPNPTPEQKDNSIKSGFQLNLNQQPQQTQPQQQQPQQVKNPFELPKPQLNNVFNNTNTNTNTNNNTNNNNNNNNNNNTNNTQWKGLNQFQNLMRPGLNNNPFKSPLTNFNFVNNLNLSNGIKSQTSTNTDTETKTDSQAPPTLSFNFNFKPMNKNTQTKPITGTSTETSPATTTTTTTKSTLQEPLRFTSFKSVDKLKELEKEKEEEVDNKKLKNKKKDLEARYETRLEEIDRRTKVLITSTTTIESLAQSLSHPLVDLVKCIIKLGVEPKSIKDILADDVIDLLSQELNFLAFREVYLDKDLKLIEKEEESLDAQSWTKRAPVVTIVGHIDHGKTSLLDYLRNTTIAKHEAGRITQHIGAFQVKLVNNADKSITFMDTPGHAAFTTMRERGVNATDIALLIVAADDGVQEQTIEAIKAIKRAGVQMIVAINKIDRLGADVEAVKKQLLVNEVALEGYGGSVPFVEISAKTGQGIEQLEETIILLSEVMDLRAPLNGRATGVVIESTFRRNRGTFTTILTKRGTLKVGDWFLCGDSHGRIKELKDHIGISYNEVLPGTPVEIFGIRSTNSPSPGDELYTFENEKKLQEVLDSIHARKHREQTLQQLEIFNKEKEQREQEEQEGSVEESDVLAQKAEEKEEKAKEDRDLEKQLGSHISVKDGKKYVSFYIKGDVGGSTEALINEMKNQLPDDPEIGFSIIRTGHGQVNEKDLTESTFLKTPIVYFGPNLNPKVTEMAQKTNIPIIQGDVIYHVIENVAKYLESQMEQIPAFDVIGVAKVQQVFPISKGGKNKVDVAGCKIQEGKFKRGSQIVIKRDNDILEGSGCLIDSIRHFKEQVKEISKGQECGIETEKQLEFLPNDIIFNIVERKEGRKLGSSQKPKYYNKY